MLCLVRSKACKRCGGDVSLECDIYGVYAVCIQCGATWSKQEPVRTTVKNTEKRAKPARANQLVVPGNKR